METSDQITEEPTERSRLFRSLTQEFQPARILEGLHQADAALVIAAHYCSHPGPYLWLCKDNRKAEEIARDVRFFVPPENQDEVLVIPGSEVDPYRGLSPHPGIAARRAAALWELAQRDQGLVITTLASLATRLPSPAGFLNHCVHLEVGSFFPMDHLVGKLGELGYLREDPVGEPGECSFRGGIVDVFPVSRQRPVRIEFFGDEVESIREFDPATQRSISLVTHCEIVPMRETVITAEEIARWHEEAPKYWSEVRFAELLQEKLQFTESGELFNGFEYLFALTNPLPANLFDFLTFQNEQPSSIILPSPQNLWEEWDSLRLEWDRSYQERHQEGDLVLPPNQLFVDRNSTQHWIQDQSTFQLEPLGHDSSPGHQFDFRPERKYYGQMKELLVDVEKWRQDGEKILFVMTTHGMAERLADIFREYELELVLGEGFHTAIEHDLSVTWGKLSESLCSPNLKLHILTESNLFEETRSKSVARESGPRISRAFLSDFRDLKEGDYVVHMDHGVGVFHGLKRIGVGEDIREFVVLGYQKDAKLYVPIDRLDLIQKYRSSGESKAQVDRLGGASWAKTKSRIKKSMRRLAEDLLKLYARRELAKGHAFSADDALTKEFEEAFEYAETPDQVAAIQDVKKDMHSERPMDRLICGDVGYGKTEVAMRAAFKAVNDGKQVTVLAPTTVLAYQHSNTFRERFKGFPVNVDMISRFRNKQEQKEILERVSLGMVDILIGTHRLLSKDVKFRDLGVIIVDEEQRFGVAQKERLKQLKTQVDVLTLSATPIPRTLNMSMIGVRDLSIIETPPKNRLAIQTTVMKFSRRIIESAIDLELKRQGQVFFLHNSVETIQSIAGMVQEIVPKARVAVAHGQMKESQLEAVMLAFLEYRYDVLICTTIIENGLDIPRANTLLVNRADRFGLAQLYQLRGRVGRSSRRAYAYLLIPSEETLSSDAQKRLAAIKDFSDLGSGFRIAALDLEIRGSGNLLGGEQHGHINAVGFELYVKLLDQSVQELKGKEPEEEIQTNIDLHFDIQIPEHYIDDPTLRLWLYKKLALLTDTEGLENLKEDIIDRFGKYPRSVSNLLEYAQLRLRCQRLKILSLDRKGTAVFLKFRQDTPIDPLRLVELIHQKKDLSLDPKGVMTIHLASQLPAQVFGSLHAGLDVLDATMDAYGSPSKPSSE